jgi:DNA topoisomerase-1
LWLQYKLASLIAFRITSEFLTLIFFCHQLNKKQNEEIMNEYGFCTIDGHKEKIGNFRIEPPGLFRGRGDHPKQGMLKRRVMPEDVIINCSK